MENTLTATSLAAALTRACAIVERRNTIPILSDVLLEASGDVLTISASDLDMQTCEAIPAAGVGVWSITAPAHPLRGIAAKAPKGAAVTFTPPGADPRLLVSVAGAGETKLPVQLPGDFPVMQFEPVHSLMFEAADLWAALGAVAPSMSTESTRFYLNGAYLHPEGDGARLAATDSHRLAVREIVTAASGDWPGVILPRGAVAWLVRHGPRAGLVTLDMSAKGFRVTGEGGAVLTSKLIDGSFPDYKRLQAQSPEAPAVTMDAAALRAGLELAACAAAKPARAVLLSLRGAEVRLFAHTVLPEVVLPTKDGPAPALGGPVRRFAQEITGETWLDAKAEPGAVLDVVMNADRLAKALKAMPKGARVTLRHEGDGKPVRIGMGGDPAEDGLVMPLADKGRLLGIAEPQAMAIAA